MAFEMIVAYMGVYHAPAEWERRKWERKNEKREKKRISFGKVQLCVQQINAW